MRVKNYYPVKHNIAFIFLCVFFIIISTIVPYAPVAKSDLPGPYYVRGYIKFYNNTSLPSGVTVTLTNIENDNYVTTTTLSGGAYQRNVGKDTGMNCDNGTGIVVRCVYGGEVGENITYINTGETFVWCNLTGGTRLVETNISIDVNLSTWDAGTIVYSGYSNTINTYFNISNNGNIKINVRIHGYNVSWGSTNYWNLTTSAAANNYTFAYQKSGESSWTKFGLTNSSSFISNLQYNSDYFSYTYWQLFGLNISFPTSSSPAPTVELNTTVRFWSIEA